MLDLNNLPTALWRGAIIASALFAVRLVGLFIYRIFFHPLAKYPGPFFAKITDAYGAYHNWAGRLHTESEVSHRKYGPIVRQGPNKLIFNSVGSLHDIYYSKDDVQKSFGYETMIPAPGAYNIFTAVDKSIHRFKRKVLSQGFSDHTIRAFEPTMIHHIDIFVRKLMGSPNNDSWSAPVNMTNASRHLQYDVMGEFGFGQSFELQTKSENHFLIDAVTATSHKAGVVVQWPKLGWIQLDQIFYRRGLWMRAKYLELMSKVVKSRLAAEKDSQHDLFSFVVDAKDPETGRGFTEEELWAESRFLLIAGADTSSTGLTGAFFYLSQYPEVYEKLKDEIRSTFSSGSEIQTGPTLANCQYLRAVIDETLRMSPPISGTLWRETLNSGIYLDGEHIPAGVDLGVNPYAVHHNEALFPDSYTFKPERWIVSDTNSKEAVEEQRHAFSPFSLGTRACAGRNMAYMELTDSLAKTAFYLDLKRADGPLGLVAGGKKGAREGLHRPNEFQLEEHLTCSHDGPFVQFRGRKGYGEELFSNISVRT